MLRLYHQVDRLDFRGCPMDFGLILAGHSHYYNVDQLSMKITVPSIAYTNSTENSLGFIELISDEVMFVTRLLDKDANIKREDRLLKQLPM